MSLKAAMIVYVVMCIALAIGCVCIHKNPEVLQWSVWTGVCVLIVCMVIGKIKSMRK